MPRFSCWIILALGVVVSACGNRNEPDFGGAERSQQSGGAEQSQNERAQAEQARPQATVVEPVRPQQVQPAGATNTAADFSVEFTTTKGVLVIDVHPSWSPLGAARFRELVQGGFFQDVAFFRVIAGFMAQFGIHGTPSVAAQWEPRSIQDDPTGRASNTRGRVSFATAGPGTRTTQLFINFGDNTQLDGMGFTPIGEVRSMAVVDRIYSGYGEGAPSGAGPAQGRISAEGNVYLRRDFPNLDYIVSARIL